MKRRIIKEMRIRSKIKMNKDPIAIEILKSELSRFHHFETSKISKMKFVKIMRQFCNMYLIGNEKNANCLKNF